MSSLPHAPGVYQIRCLVNGRLYVGSSNNLNKRWLYHARDLRVGCHYSKDLQADYDRYGRDAFAFEIIELVLEPFLRDREQYWLDKLRPYEHGYNIGRNARSDMLGLRLTDEQRQRLSESQKKLDRRISPEQRAKMVAGIRKPEAREKIGAIRRGKRWPENERRHYILTDPLGQEHYVTNITVFATENGLSRGNLIAVAQGHRKQHKGWLCRHAGNERRA